MRLKNTRKQYFKCKYNVLLRILNRSFFAASPTADILFFVSSASIAAIASLQITRESKVLFLKSHVSP